MFMLVVNSIGDAGVVRGASADGKKLKVDWNNGGYQWEEEENLHLIGRTTWAGQSWKEKISTADDREIITNYRY